MLDESRDPRPDARPTRRGLRPIFLWTMLALVGVTAVGSSTLVSLADHVGYTGYLSWGWAATVLHWGTIALILATIVVAPLAMIRSRTQGREFSRSYGGAAVLAAATGLGFAALQTLSVMHRFTHQNHSLTRSRGEYWPAYIEMTVPAAVESSIIAIVAVWMILALTGAGRRASRGFERLCLCLGLLWIVAYVARRVQDVTAWLF